MLEKWKTRLKTAREKFRKFDYQPSKRTILGTLDRILENMKGSLSNSSNNFVVILLIPVYISLLLLLKLNSVLQWLIPMAIQLFDTLGLLILDFFSAVVEELGFYWRFFAETSEYAGFPLRHLLDRLKEQVEAEFQIQAPADTQRVELASFTPPETPEVVENAGVSLRKVEDPFAVDTQASSETPTATASTVFTYSQTLGTAFLRSALWFGAFFLAILMMVGIITLILFPVSSYLLRPYLEGLKLGQNDPYRALYFKEESQKVVFSAETDRDTKNDEKKVDESAIHVSTENGQIFGFIEKNRGILTSFAVIILVISIALDLFYSTLITILVLSLLGILAHFILRFLTTSGNSPTQNS